jgi:DNA repair protein RadC
LNTRFASVHLNIERELPDVSDLPQILREFGLHTLVQESLWVVTYDSLMQIRTIIEVARGGYHSMDISLPTILSAVLVAGTDRFLIAHNHSSGDVAPTEIDMDLTRKLMTASNSCGLYFEDHLILSPDGKTFSFAASKLLVPAKSLKTLAKNNRKANIAA